MGVVVTRFAPSPTGYLHLGHAASAAQAFGYAGKHGGTCLLRIEDIDTTRCKPEYKQGIYEDLAWLGFTWPTPVRVQSEHFSEYADVITALQQKGLVYRCFKTRKEIMEDIARAPHGLGKPYFSSQNPLSEDEEASKLTKGTAFAWRLSLSAAKNYLGSRYDKLYFNNNGVQARANPDLLGDVILARKDVGTSYHIACCHDDALQGVTDIVRGVDLLESTHIHRLLQELMDWPVPNYHHHALLTDAHGKRFAKRDKSLTLQGLRKAGANPINILAQYSLA